MRRAVFAPSSSRRSVSTRSPLALVGAPLLLSLFALVAPPPASADYSVADSLAGPLFDGLGASFSGASARLLLDYDDASQSAMLDLLFAPSGPPSTPATFKGAALSILRLEVGGDANTGAGAEPAYLHSPADAPNVRRGWAGWLAKEATLRNPAIKVLVTPAAWPAFLGGSSADPFGGGVEDAVAAYVANYVALLKTELSVAVGYVGLWRSPRADVLALPSIARYATALRAQLDAAGCGDVAIVCADGGDAGGGPGAWACAYATDASNATAYSAQLADAVGVLGDASRPPASWPPGAGGGSLPVWVTGFTMQKVGAQPLIELAALGVASEWAGAFVASPQIGGFVYDVGLSASPYGFPRWHAGLLSASHPWSSSWSQSVALYAFGHVNQFVPAGGDWRILPVGSGSGALAGGGVYVGFFSPSLLQWTLVVQKFCCQLCGCNAASVVDEVATFALGGALAGAGASSAQVWLSSYPVHGFFGESDANRSWASFARQPSASLLGGSFSLQLSPGDLVTVSTLAGASTPFRGCASNDCASEPPPPTAQGAGSLSFVQLEGAPTAAPGRFMTDVSGAFEIAADPSRPATTVLAQVASGRPVGAPYDGTRPHSITGDLDTTDADVAADVLLAQADGSAALLGAHVFTFHSATPSTLDAAPGIWLRVARRDAQTLSWALLSGLDDARYLAPVSAGDLPLGAPLGAASWLRLRLVVRGNRSVGYVSVDGGASLLLFSADVGAWAPRAGFFGVGTGSYTPNEAVFRSLSINAAATTCDAAPAEGAPVEVEMCQARSAGQTFELWLPRDTAAGAFSYSSIPSFDAPDEDCGKFGSDSSTWLGACAGNYTAVLNGSVAPGSGCSCVAWNSNGYGKAAFSDLEVYAYGSVSLNVLQPPLGQLRLSANTSLCLAVGAADGGALVLAACADDAVGGAIPLSQLFGLSRSLLVDGATLGGPLLFGQDQPGPAPVPGGSPCVDVWNLSVDVDHAVRQGSWNSGSNQIFSFPWGVRAPMLVRAPHMEVCLGACAAL